MRRECLALFALQAWLAEAATVGQTRSATAAFRAPPRCLPGSVGNLRSNRCARPLSSATARWHAETTEPGNVRGYARRAFNHRIACVRSQQVCTRNIMTHIVCLVLCVVSVLSWTGVLGMRKAFDQQVAGARSHHARAHAQQNRPILPSRRQSRCWLRG